MSEINATAIKPTRRENLARLLRPRSIAIVGVSENSPYALNARMSLEGSDVDIHFVHPRFDTLFGRPCVPSLDALDSPVDAVFSATAATRTLEIARQAADMGAAGVITIAAGFAEVGEAGQSIQRELRQIADAARMHVIGPNGVGMINVPAGLSLTMLAPFERRVGGVSAVTHSGAMIEAIGSAAHHAGGIGLNILVSAGNEAVTDLADYLDFLVDDENTKVIILALEKIRRPTEFFAAAERALRAGKPIVAVKLGRSARSQKMAKSHTGTIVGDTWVYDVALRQAGIQLAEDIDDLVQRVQYLERFPREKWSPVKGLAVITATGGFAQLAGDLSEAEGIVIPDLTELEPFIAENVPGGAVANPLDSTVFASSTPGMWEKIVRTYADDDNVDSLIMFNQQADWDERNRHMSDTVVACAKDYSKPFMVAPLAGQPGWWMQEYDDAGVALSKGLKAALRGLGTMGAFMRTRRDSRVAPPSEAIEITRPRSTPIDVPEGKMLSFADTMELVRSAGIPVAPYALLEGPDSELPTFDGPYVVKLADVAHRTEHNAVRVGVDRFDIPAAVRELQAIAKIDGLPSLIAVQSMVAGIGEAFIGIQGASELGPVVAFGLGGIFVEVLKRVGGRVAPFTRVDAGELISEFDDLGVLDGHRGRPGWNRDDLASLLFHAGQLAAGGRAWIESIDLNPLIVTADGFVAVDALCLVKD